MSASTFTPHYELPQFSPDDIPQWVADITTAFSKIDTAIYEASQTGGEEGETVDETARETAQQALTSASSALDSANSAQTTANSAKSTADESKEAAETANSLATQNQSSINSINTSISTLNSYLNNLIGFMEMKINFIQYFSGSGSGAIAASITPYIDSITQSGVKLYCDCYLPMEYSSAFFGISLTFSNHKPSSSPILLISGVGSGGIITLSNPTIGTTLYNYKSSQEYSIPANQLFRIYFQSPVNFST